MTEAERAVPRRLIRVRRMFAGAGRVLVANMCMAGLWTGNVMFDASMFKALNDWARQGRRESRDWPDPEADRGLLPAPPAPAPERLIPEVPLSPRERELWADLLGAGREARSGRSQRRFRLLRERLLPNQSPAS